MVKRQSPDTALHQAQREERAAHRGKLKIYLGAAPGVGKTYEMLQDALAMREQGLDVVVGVVESHGRQAIEALLEKFETIPRQSIDYQGRQLLAFSLEKALQRSPGLILVDEMAHSNVGGLRHEKRWQDINELLDRGIDVWTTLNVQHIESLNDAVVQIIKAPVNETVPNGIIEQADAIELVDLPPEDLLKRLQEGKIYIPQQAQFATQHFFRKGNLIALRELALRVVADHVGVDVMLYRQGEGIQRIWATKEKILVCVGTKPGSRKLIRVAKRIASGLQAQWIAVFVDTPTMQRAVEKRNCAIENLRLAELLGAETHVLSGVDIVEEILLFAREQNVTQILMRKQIITRWRDWFSRRLADEMLRQSGEIDVYIMTGEERERSVKKSSRIRGMAWRLYGVALALIAAATFFNVLIAPYVSSVYLVAAYVLAILLVAFFGKIGLSLFASILCVCAYNFFFVVPLYSFAIFNHAAFFVLLFLLVVTQVISYFIIKAQKQTAIARANQHQLAALYTLSRQLTRTHGVEEVLTLGARYIGSTFHCKVMALLPVDNTLVVRAVFPSLDALDEKEHSIAQWVYDMGQRAGLGTDTLSFSKAFYVPMMAPQGAMGVLRIQPDSAQLMTPDQSGLLDACINQIALALEVQQLQEEMRKQEIKTEVERARNVLFQTMSQDITEPLKLIIDVFSTERQSPKDATHIREKRFDWEIDNLARLNQNMALVIQMESEMGDVSKTPTSLDQLLSTTLMLAEKMLDKKPVRVDLPDDTPWVPLNEKLIQDVILNLIHNAIKFTLAGTPITISVHCAATEVIICVRDEGPGVLAAEREHIFEKFYRGQQVLSKRGIGLGLSICQKIVHAHGGKIWVENNQERGASFCFSLPLG